MYVNTAWMLEGAHCWYNNEKAVIQKLLQQRTIAKLLVGSQTLEVRVSDLCRASNAKVLDLVDLPHVNVPEVLSRITQPIFIDRLILVPNNKPTLKDHAEYQMHLGDRFIKSTVPPHLFAAAVLAMKDLDLGKNSQIYVSGINAKERINDLIGFFGGESNRLIFSNRRLARGVHQGEIQIITINECDEIMDSFASLRDSLIADGLTDLAQQIPESHRKEGIFVHTADPAEVEQYIAQIQMIKNIYPVQIKFQEFYSRYHVLDTFNKRIPLRKHLQNGQDMRALCVEIGKRVIQGKGLVFGSQVYMKRFAEQNLNQLICQYNIRLSNFARIIQRVIRIRKFRQVVMKSIKALLKKQPIVAPVEKQSLIIPVKYEVSISDSESYSLLTSDQITQYDMLKQEQAKNRQQCLLEGVEFKEQQVAIKLLTQDQIKTLNDLKQQKQQQRDVSEIENMEHSDLECFEMLSHDQRINYLQRKRQNHTNVAFSLLSHTQQQQIKGIRTRREQKEALQKYYESLEPYLSDIEAYKQLSAYQQNEYKSLKLQNKDRVAFNLLNNQQHQLRQRNLVLQNKKYLLKKEFLVDDDLSDADSYLLLQEVQKEQYKKEKKRRIEVQQQQNFIKYQIHLQISDEESFQLCDKEQYFKLKSLSKDISDLDMYTYAKDTENYWQRKANGEENVAKSMLSHAELQAVIEKKSIIQARLDEVPAQLDSIAFRLLTDQAWQVRKQSLVEQQKRISHKKQAGFFCDEIESVAFELLTVQQKQERKRQELHKFKLRQILNPILFEEELNEDYSIAYRLLKNKDVVYGKYSLASQLCNVNRELDLYPWEYYTVKTLHEKQTIIQDRISQYEQDLAMNNRTEFSDYEAFKLLDQQVQANAYSFLDEGQKIQHRKIMLSKQIRNGAISDQEAYNQLDEAQRARYHVLKEEDVSDYPAYQALENKELYRELKLLKLQRLAKIHSLNLKVIYTPNAQVLTLQEFKDLERQAIENRRNIESETVPIQFDIVEQVQSTNFVSKLIENPESQPYLIPKCQGSRHLLDPSAALECYDKLQIDQIELLNTNRFVDYIAELNVKSMKCQTEKLKKPLIAGAPETALEVFSAIMKFAHMKRSRYTVQEHLQRILSVFLKKIPAPQKKLEREFQVEPDIKNTLNEEVYLQIFKELEGNRREHIASLLRLGIVLSSCVACPRPLPLIQYLWEKLSQKYDHEDIQKLAKQLIRNLSQPFTPREFLPSEQELQIMMECKQVIIKLTLFSGTPIWVQIGHAYSVKDTVKAACSYIGKLNRIQNFGLTLMSKKGSMTKVQYAIPDNLNMMDLVNKYDYYEEAFQKQFGQQRSFDFYLTIREPYTIHRDDFDSIDLLFYQVRVQNPKRDNILDALETFAIYNIESPLFKMSKYEAKLEFINILQLRE